MRHRVKGQSRKLSRASAFVDMERESLQRRIAEEERASLLERGGALTGFRAFRACDGNHQAYMGSALIQSAVYSALEGTRSTKVLTPPGTSLITPWYGSRIIDRLPRLSSDEIITTLRRRTGSMPRRIGGTVLRTKVFYQQQRGNLAEKAFVGLVLDDALSTQLLQESISLLNAIGLVQEAAEFGAEGIKHVSVVSAYSPDEAKLVAGRINTSITAAPEPIDINFKRPEVVEKPYLGVLAI